MKVPYLLAAGLVLGLSLLGGAGARADDTRLTVVQDESSLEKLIESFLMREHKLLITEKTAANDPNDLYLELPFKGVPMPKYRIDLDTQPLNTDPDTKAVIERGVLCNLYTGINVPAEHRAAVMELLNDLNRRKAFASVYIDTDGEIVCSWIINVLAQGMPTENVFDEVARVDKIWAVLWPDVAKELGLPNQTAEANPVNPAP